MTQINRRSDPLKPSTTLLCKLGSIAAHAIEAASDDRHPFDVIALRQLLTDKEVFRWLSDMNKLALVPLARKGKK